MKYNFFLLTVAMFLMAGCSKSDDSSALKRTELTITATLGDENTKTTLIDGGTDVYWEPGDEIKVFYGTGKGRFGIMNSEYVKTAQFTGSIDIVIGGNEEFPKGEKMWGLYPYRTDATYDGSSVTTTLPDFQNGKAGSFAKNTNLTLARSSNLALAFYNVCGGICFTLSRDDVMEVVFEGRNGEDIAGTVKLGFDGEVPVVKSVKEGKKAITLTAPGGGTFAAGTKYYIVALPCVLDSGFRLTINTATQYAVLSKADSKTIRRGSFGIINNADEGLIFKDKGSGPKVGNIVFKDTLAKVACVTAFDTNMDGELSYDEAAAVKELPRGLFTNWPDVTHFDELKFFTSLTEISYGALSELKSLKSLTLPINIKVIQNLRFCPSLDSLTIESDIITRIEGAALEGCSSLKSFDFKSGLKYIGNYAFRGTALRSVDLPATVETVGYDAFKNCSFLVSVVIPNSVKNFGHSVFQNCTSLVSASLPSGLETIPSYTFYNCYRLVNFAFPKDITKIERGAFHYCCLETDDVSKIEIPSGVTYIGELNFECVRNVMISSQSLISIPSAANYQTFGTRTKIYVPSDRVELYKSAWPEHAPYIYAHEDYSGDEAPVGTVNMGTDVFWSTCNLGASNPKDFGDYYAWGEIEPYYESQNPLVWKEGKEAGYASSNYRWYDKDTGLTKYCNHSDYGVVDNKIILEKSDDAASQKLGGNFCMPSHEEMSALYDLCSWKEAYLDGQLGFEITSKSTGNSIFLPATDYRAQTSIKSSNMRYWTASYRGGLEAITCYLEFGESPRYFSYRDYRFIGHTIRPVSY